MSALAGESVGEGEEKMNQLYHWGELAESVEVLVFSVPVEQAAKIAITEITKFV